MSARTVSKRPSPWSSPPAGTYLKFKIIRPEADDGTSIETKEHVCKKPTPTLEELHAMLDPVLGTSHFEHVTVLADFRGGTRYKRADMFVDEDGKLKNLPRNHVATIIYRRNWLMQHPGTDPESLHEIVGPAVLFERIVWR